MAAQARARAGVRHHGREGDGRWDPALNSKPPSAPPYSPRPRRRGQDPRTEAKSLKGGRGFLGGDVLGLRALWGGEDKGCVPSLGQLLVRSSDWTEAHADLPSSDMLSYAC